MEPHKHDAVRGDHQRGRVRDEAAGHGDRTAVVLDEKGELVGRYRKMHIPDDPLYYEKFYFTPGDLGFKVHDTAAGRLGVLVINEIPAVGLDFVSYNADQVAAHLATCKRQVAELIARDKNHPSTIMWSVANEPIGGSFFSQAIDVSADGSIIVGQSSGASGTEAYRWTSGTGMVGIGDLAGGGFGSQANGISADGTIIVGRGTEAGGDRAFLWTQSLGMTNLKDFLIGNGATGLAGWTLLEARGISADGTAIVGVGFNPDGNIEAWLATVPEPSTLALAGCGIFAFVVVARRRLR